MPKARAKAEDDKTYNLRVRLTDAQRALLAEAAEVRGLDVSSWVRSVALREAGAVLREARGGAPAP